MENKEPFASLLKGDLKGALAGGEPAIFQLVMATHAGMTTEEFEKIVKDWIATAKHPMTKRLTPRWSISRCWNCSTYLRANGFKTFIVSGGGIEFMRPWTEKVYGIPPEQVVGSSGKTKFEMRDGKPVLMRLPELNFIDDKAGKPVAIQPTSAAAPSWPSTIPTATSRCWSGRPPGAARDSGLSRTIPMLNASGPTTARLISDSSTKPGTKRRRKVGPSWT